MAHRMMNDVILVELTSLLALQDIFMKSKNFVMVPGIFMVLYCYFLYILKMENVIYFLFLGFLVPSLSMFILKCFDSGMIFRRYYVLLNYLWIKSRREPLRKFRFLLKPMGLCVYCYNAWLSILVGLLFGVGLLYMPLFVGFTYVVLEVYKKMLGK